MADLKVVHIPVAGSVATMLRDIADAIDAGEYGPVEEGSLVLVGHELEVFRLGRADSTAAHYILCCSADKLRRPMVDAAPLEEVKG